MGKTSTFFKALSFYIANHLIANIPSFTIRHWYYNKILGYKIGKLSSIHMGVFVTGDNISIGDNVVINRKCYLDGRIGIEIKDNVSVSPEAYIISMEHDPDDPFFRTRGKVVIVEANTWIGSRAIILPGVKIGEGAIIGAGSVVTKEVGPFIIAAGIPAREIRSRNKDIKYKVVYFPWFDTDIQR